MYTVPEPVTGVAAVLTQKLTTKSPLTVAVLVVVARVDYFKVIVNELEEIEQ